MTSTVVTTPDIRGKPPDADMEAASATVTQDKSSPIVDCTAFRITKTGTVSNMLQKKIETEENDKESSCLKDHAKCIGEKEVGLCQGSAAWIFIEHLCAQQLPHLYNPTKVIL